MPVRLNIRSLPGGPRVLPELLRQRVEWLLRRYRVADRVVSVVLLGDEEMADFNRRYRGRAGATNVLSFPFEPGDLPPGADSGRELGDILVSVDTAAREAGERKISLHERFTEKELFQEMKSSRRKTMVQLAINVDHVATVRQARGGAEPDPVLAAGMCELAGASGIVVHLREDRRHIQERDVRLLRQTIKTKLNLEMAMSAEIIDIALDIKPDMVTLVPEKRKELTTEGGLDVAGNKKKARKTIAKMYKAGIPVSLFVDPEEAQIKAAVEVGADFVELHTGRYCDAVTGKERLAEFELIQKAAESAFEAGLRVNAGHGLDYRNTAPIAALEPIEELSIGHAVMARAVFVGLDRAVGEMLAIIEGSRL
jgi:pyridoxine 5-phosphate synthase